MTQQVWRNLQFINIKVRVKNSFVSAYLDEGDVLFRLQLGDVILELDNDFDQAHDGLVHFVVRAVQLGGGRGLKKENNVFFNNGKSSLLCTKDQWTHLNCTEASLPFQLQGNLTSSR